MYHYQWFSPNRSQSQLLCAQPCTMYAPQSLLPLSLFILPFSFVVRLIGFSSAKYPAKVDVNVGTTKVDNFLCVCVSLTEHRIEWMTSDFRCISHDWTYVKQFNLHTFRVMNKAEPRLVSFIDCTRWWEGVGPSQGLYLHSSTKRRKPRTNIHAPSGMWTCNPIVLTVIENMKLVNVITISAVVQQFCETCKI